MSNLPSKGLELDILKKRVEDLKQKDVQWINGKSFALVYYPGKEISEKIEAIANLYMHDNALNPTATPSLTRMEVDVLEMCAKLFGGNERTRGNITSGGTESILLAVKTAREWGIKKRKIQQGHVVVTESIHPAFFKAFKYFGLDYTITKNKENGEADPLKIKESIQSNTVLVAVSAPSYPYGILDPIEEVAEITKDRGVLLHVDACVGGFALPFMKEAGYNVPKWNFEVEGVTSISADMHKYGYSPKGISIIMYRNAELRKHQYYVYTDWIGGVYGSPNISGTRPGASIAAAWATLMGIGREGYVNLVKTSMDVRYKVQLGIENIPELEIIGNPIMSMLAFKSSVIDVFQLADELNALGWHFDKQQNPASLHLTFNSIHKGHEDDFLNDLKLCIEKVKKFSFEKVGNKLQVSLVKGLSKMLPNGAIAKFQKGKASPTGSHKTAAMYGMMGALSGSGDLEEIVLDFLDQTYAPSQD